jgi:hypothetical protein
MKFSILYRNLVNCLCGELNDFHYEKIEKLSKNNYCLENTMAINNVEFIYDYDIIDKKDIKDL